MPNIRIRLEDIKSALLTSMCMNMHTTSPAYATLCKVLAFAILLSYSIAYGYAQDGLAKAQAEQDKMFQYLDRSSVSTGLLRDYAINFEDLDIFSGSSSSDKEKSLVTPIRYADILTTIRSACLDQQRGKRLEQQFQKILKERECASLSVALYKYECIKENALRDRLIRYEDGRVYTIKGRHPYEVRFAFAGCILTNDLNNDRLQISYPKELEFSNCEIAKVELEYKGKVQAISHGGSITLHLEEGSNDIAIIATTRDGNTYTSHSEVHVKKDSLQQLRSLGKSRELLPFDSCFPVEDAKPYRGIKTEADVYIKYASGHNGIVRPLIIVEGFDPRSNSTPLGNWSFSRGNIPYSLTDFADENGYDIVYVDWRNSEEYIQANAATLETIIQKINKKKDEAGYRYGNVILAHSMGGLITRYALKTMENRHIRHEVDTFISYDVPHLGAHIPIGTLYGFYGLQKFIESRGLAGKMALQFSGYSDLLEWGKKLAYSTAAQQMLINFVDPAGNFNNQEHIHWQKELNDLGFPNGDPGKPIRLLAVANGSYQQQNAIDYYLKTDFEAGSNVLPAIHALSYLVTKSPLSVGLAAFSLNDVVSGMLTLLPGRSSVQGHCYLLPAAHPGALVTDIEMTYKNKFLWMIDITRTLFSFSRNAPHGLLFDKYPGSTYSLPRTSSSIPLTGEDSNILFDDKYDIKVCDYIPFIPTSSALARGNGLQMKPEVFYNQPQRDEAPFFGNFYTHKKSQGHESFTESGIAWIRSQLLSSIFGPELGYSGAQYSLFGSKFGSIAWSTSDPSIATINSAGILTAIGSGDIQLIAICNGATYRKHITVGLPLCVLRASHEPGGYKIVASCIDEKRAHVLHNLDGILKYRWGVKVGTSDIVWEESSSPQLTIKLYDEDDQQVVIFMEVSDNQGNRTPMVHTSLRSKSIYYTSYPHLIFFSDGRLFEENMSPYSLDIAYIDLIEKEDLTGEYSSSDWLPVTASILSPSGRRYRVDLVNYEIMVADILDQSERSWLAQCHESLQEFTYIIELENTDQKTIQYLPLRITYKKA